jgi:transcriptional regulator with XRE-family HTH domain
MSSTFLYRKENFMYPRIKELREQHGLSQRKAAELLEMHTTQYQRYETGERTVPADFLIKLADLYNVSIDYIVGRSNDHATEAEHVG